MPADIDPNTGGRADDQPRPRRRRFSEEIDELPWWAGVLLTMGDVLNRPWVSVTVWSVVVARAGLRVWRRSRPPG